ncbi:uncharacterized protein LOC143861144 isoform X2 [Tasmannia lanceolata]|uniref:uncharacterized protein LOC143861144 isoform X2 n=1 Tax=Tasmannia lanceolata TaxID=3420 RepID=UPI0040647FB7
MISNKVVLTYKRKRLSSQFEIPQGIKGASTSCDSPRSTPTIITQKDDSKTRHLTAKQKSDDEHYVQCVICDIDGNLLGCDSCPRTYHLHCVDPPLQHFPPGKWLCSVCSEHSGPGKSSQQRVREPRTARAKKCIEGSEMGPNTLRSRKVLLKVHRDKNTSSKEKDISLKKDASSEKNSNSIQIDVDSHLSSGTPCKVADIKRRSLSRLIEMDTANRSSSVCLDSSIEKNHGPGYQEASLSKTFPSETSDLPHQVNSNVPCSDVLPNKFNSPLITFSRRAKKKELVNRRAIENKTEESKCSGIEWSNCGTGVSGSREGASRKYNSEGPSTAVDLIEGQEMSPLLMQRQYKIDDKEEDGNFKSTSSGCALETKNADHRTEQNSRQSLLEGSSMVECVPELNPGHSLSSLHPRPNHPIKCVDTSPSTDVIKKPFFGEASQTTITGAEKSEGTARLDNISENGSSLAHLELSVAPPGSIGPSNLVSDQKVNSLPTSKPSIDAVSENFLGSPNSSSSQHAIVLHEETIEREGLQFSETLDETTGETPYHQTQKDEKRYSSVEEDGICYKKTYGGVTSYSISGGILNQVPPVSCISQDATTCLDFQRRIFLPHSSFENNQYKTATKTSVCPNFLGLSLPMKPGPTICSVKDLPPSIPSLDQRLAWQDILLPSASHKNSSFLRHKQLLDNVVNNAGMLKGSQCCSSEKLVGFANTWSEEELDNLWIGVRRHGRDNWDAMLGDPKLHFSEWRVAEDLSMRWDEEQAKLLNGPMVESRHSSYITEHRESPRFQTLTTETQLTLGDVYGHKEENTRKRYPFHLSGPCSAPSMAKNDMSNMDSLYLINSNLRSSALQKMGAKQQKPIKGQRHPLYSDSKQVRYDRGLSILPQKPIDRSPSHPLWSGELFGCGKDKATSNESVSTDDLPAGLPTKGNLPHWLREVLTAPSRPTEPELPPGISAIAHSVGVLYNDKPVIPPFSDLGVPPPVPPKDPRPRPGRTGGITSKVGTLRVSDLPASIAHPVAGFTNVSWMESGLSLIPTLGSTSTTLKPASEFRVSYQNNTADFCQFSSDPFRPNDLIVIDSEASSEETISDDQSGRL